MKNNKEDTIRRDGTITKVHGGIYEVEDAATKLKIMCTLSGKMRMNSIKIVVGDKVDVDVSVYDLTKGRIVYRHK